MIIHCVSVMVERQEGRSGIIWVTVMNIALRNHPSFGYFFKFGSGADIYATSLAYLTFVSRK